MKTSTSDLAMAYIASNAFIAGAESVKSSMPTDQQVKDYISTLPYHGHCTTEWHEGIEDGVKFVKEQLP
jgi:hypothetical protein